MDGYYITLDFNNFLWEEAEIAEEMKINVREIGRGTGIKAVRRMMKIKETKTTKVTKAAKATKTGTGKRAKLAKAVKAGAIAGGLCLFMAGGIHSGYAYFSGTSEMKVNQLSIAGGEQDQEGALMIVEPEWDARKEADGNYAMNMQPGESAVKDPRVESRIDYPCWVFVEVMIPEEWATLGKADNPYEYVALAGDGTDYTYAFEIVVPEINREDWELYQRSYGKNIISYMYGCRTPLNAYGTTSAVFHSITVPEFKQFEGGENYIFIRAKGIQTEGCPTLDDAAKKLGIEKTIQQTTVNP